MTGIVLSAEQIRAAPPAVRRWLELQMAAAFEGAAAAPAAAEPEAGDDATLAACDRREVDRIFEALRQDPVAGSILLDLGREPVTPLHPSPLYDIDLADVARDTGIADQGELAAGFAHINDALRAVRHDPAATLCGFDAAGRCYLHEATHRAIHQLWDDLRRPRTAAQWPPAHWAQDLVGCDPPYHRGSIAVAPARRAH